MCAGQVSFQLSYAPAPALVFILYYFLQEPLDNEYPLPIILITYANNDQGTDSKPSLATEEKGHCKSLMFLTAHAQGRKRYFPGKREDGWKWQKCCCPPSLPAGTQYCGRQCEIGLAANSSSTPDSGKGESTLSWVPHTKSRKRKSCCYGCGEKLLV